MKVKNITVKQIMNACLKNKYLLLRTTNGNLLAVNARAGNIAKKRKEYRPNNKTDFTSITPCDLNTYITHKVAFIRSNLK